MTHTSPVGSVARRTIFLLLVTVMPSVVAAQGAPSERPFRALFGGSEADPNAHNELNALLFVGGGFDDNVAVTLGSSNPGLQLRAPYGSLGGNLAYRHEGRHFEFGADGSGTFRYLDTNKRLEATALVAIVQLNWQVTRRTTIGVSQDVNHSPHFEFGLFSPLEPTSPLALGSSDLSRSAIKVPTTTYSSAISFGRELGPQSRIGAEYSVRYLDVGTGATEAENKEFVAHRAGIHFEKDLTENFAARLGYAFAISPINLVTGSGVGKNHDLDIGIDYSRELTVSQATTFTMGFGSTIATRNDPDASRVTGGPSTQSVYALLASALLQHRFGSDWSASVSYDRSVNYVDAFGETLFGNTINTSLGGHLTRRLSLVGVFNYLSGKAGFGGSNEVTTSNAAAGVRFAITRFLAFDAQYDYYHYKFGADVRVFADVARTMERNSARAGLTLWLPLARY